jgi:uncharacterized membrane protein YccF (DUF307 family)
LSNHCSALIGAKGAGEGKEIGKNFVRERRAEQADDVRLIMIPAMTNSADCDRPEAVYITARWSNMSLFAFLLNLLWIVFGGLWMAIGWVIAAVIMAITIVGIPWARAAFNIASYTLLPFGRKAVSRAEYSGRHDLGTGPFGLIGNLIWLVLAGWWLALGHLITAIMLAVTIIGIPFAWAHLKLAGIALWPIGKEIVAADAVPFSRSTAQR